MRTTISKFALAPLFIAVGLAQTPITGPDHTFYLTSLTGTSDLTSMATALRTVVDITQITPDVNRNALTIKATTEKLMAADWVIHQLDRPATGDGLVVSPDFKMTSDGEVIRVLWIGSSATQATLTSMVTAIRTVADLQRLMPLEAVHAILSRGPLEKVNAAEWMSRELVPVDGKPLTGNSSAYPMARVNANQDDEIIRVFRLAPDVTNATLTSVVTAIRTVADIQRVMPQELGKAIVSRASSEKMAVAEWIVQEVNATQHPAAIAEMQAQDPRNQNRGENTVRIFYLHGTTAEITDIATEIRTTSGIQRLFPMANLSAILARGRADQMSTAALIVNRHASESGAK